MIEFRGKECDIVTIDFETYYAKDYSLTTMPTSAYVRDKRFFVQMMGLKINDEPTVIYTDPTHILLRLRSIDWKRSLLLCHNTSFDGFICLHKYRIKPFGYLDTLSMARAVLGHSVSHRLDNVGKCLGLGGKEGKDALEDAKGVRNLPADLLERMGTYCTRDVELCYKIFHKMYDHFPDDELELVDLTIRMFCEPTFIIDKALVQEELEEEISGKMRHLMTTGAQRADLMSNTKFVALVQAAGGSVATKISPATGKTAPALAKTDQGMRDLLNHPIQAVRELAQARLATKSTIGETRAQRFLDTASAGRMPVLLHYYGAHTGRWSGGDKMNLQNLPRPQYLEDGSVDPKTGRLRRSLRAPKGRMIVVADSGQIEARVNAWLAGQKDMLDIFRAYDAGIGPDAYRVMAAKLFSVPIDKVTKEQRFIGKVCVLALGYGMGAQKLCDTLANASVIIDLDQCADWVHTYRATNNWIHRSWRHYQTLLPRMVLKDIQIPVGPLTLVHEAVRLPNGLFIRYPELQLTQGDWENAIGEATFQGRNARQKLYGGLLCENFVQALSRCIIAEQVLTLSRMGIRIITTTHDEIVAVAPAKQAEKVFNKMIKVMSTPPSWAPDLPLAAAGGWAENYSK